MLRRLLNLKPTPPKPTQAVDVFAALSNLPQFSLARAAQGPQQGGA